MTHYIIFSTKTDYVRAAYLGIANLKNVTYQEHNLIRSYHSFCNIFHVPKMNLIYSILNHILLNTVRKSADKLCFIYHGVSNLPLIENGFIQHARKLLPTSRHVGVFWDVFDFRKLNVPALKNTLDLVITPDVADAARTGATFYPLFYSAIPPTKESGIEKGGVFFCGEDGGRLACLEEIYDYLTNHGVPCHFFCSNSNEAGKTLNGIHHIDSMSHEEYVSRIRCCDVLLDIVKPGASCCSLRVCEAVSYQVRLLTNNTQVKLLPYYSTDCMEIFSTTEDINLAFFKQTQKPIYPNADAVSPAGFLDFLDRELKDRTNCEQ